MADPEPLDGALIVPQKRPKLDENAITDAQQHLAEGGFGYPDTEDRRRSHTGFFVYAEEIK